MAYIVITGYMWFRVFADIINIDLIGITPSVGSDNTFDTLTIGMRRDY